MKKMLSLYFFIVLLIVSCTKQSISEQDTIKPKIEVVYPIDDPVIRSGDPLCMKVLISDNKSLMSVWLQVNDGHGFKKEYSIPGRSMDIIEKYIAPSGVNGNLIAKFFAVDEVGYLSSEEIKFAVNN